MRPSVGFKRKLALALPPTLVILLAATEAPLEGAQLTAALEQGGYVILMRHANSPGTPPDPGQADPANVKHERQLDETGRASARALGEAFRRLQIPVGEVLSSPTYRALETAQLAQLPAAQTLEQLGDAGKSMSPDAAGTRGAWLRSRVAKAPKPGTDTVIITHYPNIKEGFPAEAKDLGEGEALIFRPDGHGAASLVARVKIEDWPRLSAGKQK
jgi:phosphohistidine phosphatase SixA